MEPSSLVTRKKKDLLFSETLLFFPFYFPLKILLLSYIWSRIRFFECY